MKKQLFFEGLELEDNVSGYRLKYFEVYNWGTFNGRPWRIDLNGESGLLTGENGSGKTTLVDGLLTLLIPGRKRRYNQASSPSLRRERTERSYIQGEYGSTRSEDQYQSKPKYLREKGTISVLLAHFFNRSVDRGFTLGQVFWIDEMTVKKIYLYSEKELTVKNDFRTGKINDLKKELKDKGVEIYDTFENYSQRFRRLINLDTEKPLDLFNQTVALKEIGSLNQFVREQMLEQFDIQSKINDLYNNYEDLVACYQFIQEAKEELNHLIPISNYHEKIVKINEEKDFNDKIKNSIEFFIASEKKKLIEIELERLKVEIKSNDKLVKQKDNELYKLRDEEKEIEFFIKTDNSYQQLHYLEREVNQIEEEIKRKRKTSERYNEAARNLKLKEYNDDFNIEDFEDNKRRVTLEIRPNIIKTIEELENEKSSLNNELFNLKSEIQGYYEEINYLRSRKSNIPRENLILREKIIRDLKLKEEDLPFIGELIEVREEEKSWKGAIERVLRHFALNLLVDGENYARLNAYVNQTHLGRRISYYPVTSIGRCVGNLDASYLPAKVEVKGDNPLFADWVRFNLNNNYNYKCCEDEEEFNRECPAVTKNGLVKHRNKRHEKDDSYRIYDFKNYVLGWRNASKIQSIELELNNLRNREEDINFRIQQNTNLLNKKREEEKSISSLLIFEHFDEIDWKSRVLDKQRKEEEIELMRKSTIHLKDLELKLKEIRNKIDLIEQEKRTIFYELSKREQKQIEFNEEINHLNSILNNCDFDIKERREIILNFLEDNGLEKNLNLENIDKQEKAIFGVIGVKEKRIQEELEKYKPLILEKMTILRQKFPEKFNDFGSDLNSVKYYLRRKEKIESDDLPRHEIRFKNLMNEKIIFSIALFKSTLEQQEEKIKESIEELNDSLRQINYSDSTYITLCCERTRNREIRDFIEDLKVCLGNIANQDIKDNEVRFYNIKNRIIDRFKSDQRWTSLVTDVRQWLDFAVSERYREDNSEKEHYTDSSGKSGGQKVKLAYTILASAIAYQYGLMGERPENSFRLVVIDEAFSKSDNKNSRYAMELFQKLNLQLLVVTPKDKIHITEPYVKTIHVVHNYGGSESILESITIEKYKEIIQNNSMMTQENE